MYDIWPDRSLESSLQQRPLPEQGRVSLSIRFTSPFSPNLTEDLTGLPLNTCDFPWKQLHQTKTLISYRPTRSVFMSFSTFFFFRSMLEYMVRLVSWPFQVNNSAGSFFQNEGWSYSWKAVEGCETLLWHTRLFYFTKSSGTPDRHTLCLRHNEWELRWNFNAFKFCSLIRDQ